jgi:hypothetical protein
VLFLDKIVEAFYGGVPSEVIFVIQSKIFNQMMQADKVLSKLK